MQKTLGIWVEAADRARLEALARTRSASAGTKIGPSTMGRIALLIGISAVEAQEAATAARTVAATASPGPSIPKGSPGIKKERDPKPLAPRPRKPRGPSVAERRATKEADEIICTQRTKEYALQLHLGRISLETAKLAADTYGLPWPLPPHERPASPPLQAPDPPSSHPGWNSSQVSGLRAALEDGTRDEADTRELAEYLGIPWEAITGELAAGAGEAPRQGQERAS